MLLQPKIYPVKIIFLFHITVLYDKRHRMNNNLSLLCLISYSSAESQAYRVTEAGEQVWRYPVQPACSEQCQLQQVSRGHFHLGFDYL